MFIKGLKKRIILVFSLFAFATIALAQYDESIAQLMTSSDGWMVYNQQQMDYTNTQVNDAINRYMQDPQIQAAYYQCQQTSNLCGDFRWFAYNYVATNGFSDGGAWMDKTREMDARTQEAWWDVQDAERRSATAIAGANGAMTDYRNEWGNIVGGDSTWIDPLTSSLPYGLQSGESWYDEGTGQYYLYNPYNWDQGAYFVSQDGYNWQQLNQWYPGQ